jgi:hypothetical protein
MVTVPLLTKATSHQRMTASVSCTTIGPPAAGDGHVAKERGNAIAGGGDDALSLRVANLECAEGLEQDGEVAAEFVGPRSGHHGQPRSARGFGEGGDATVDGLEVEGLIEEEVPDEAGGHVALAEELLLEGEDAEHHVGQSPELVDAPASPRPDLRGDEVHDPRAVAFGDGADGGVGRG